MMAEFLFEIGLEEIPARMIAGAQAELEKRVVAMLGRERLAVAGVAVKSFSTPRRLAVWVGEVAERQEDVAEELLGPSAKIAYKDGVPGPAAVAFAKKAGVAVEALKTVTTPKGEYLQATAIKPGRTAAAVIAAELPKELAAIYWAKNMYWRAGRPERFVRPVRWLLALLGEEVVPVEFAGYTASNVTFGHRVLFGAAPIPVDVPERYEEKLKAAFVLADVEARRHTIRKALDRVCRTLPDTRWREDHALVDKLTHLTEWPTVIAGSFEPEYLALPEEVLVTVMRDHQSYFAVEDKTGKLAPHFLAVLNTQADAAGEAVIRHGNARVLRARFNDARFFWEFDQRVPLVERVALLGKVTFQKDLGSYAAKTERIAITARFLVEAVQILLPQTNIDAVMRAIHLLKTDLTSELVKEFTELQGVVGGLYASAQGESLLVAKIIYEQYLPVSGEGSIPTTIEGCIVGLLDRADTLAGMFTLGIEPSGSKDPFGLRRSGNAIVRIIAETQIGMLPLLQIGLVDWSTARFYHPETPGFAEGLQSTRQRLKIFLRERLEFYLREARGHSYDVVKAVLAVGNDDVRDAVTRAEALSAVRGSDDFAAVSAAFKRMKNIWSQAAEKGIAAAVQVNTALLIEPSEQTLASHAAELAVRVAKLRAEKNYVAALETIATLRPQVDAFFDAVMVMAPDEAVRANRLALLAKVLEDFSGIADFSEIVTQGG